jgi:hypothetical protein
VEPDANDAAPAGNFALGERARTVLETLSGLEAELKGAAIFSSGGEILACTVDRPGWGSAALELLEALRAAAEGDLDSSHVATEEGEVFVVTEGDLALVAVTARFVLASLTTFDMRMALRDLAASHA